MIEKIIENMVIQVDELSVEQARAELAFLYSVHNEDLNKMNITTTERAIKLYQRCVDCPILTKDEYKPTITEYMKNSIMSVIIRIIYMRNQQIVWSEQGDGSSGANKKMKQSPKDREIKEKAMKII